MLLFFILILYRGSCIRSAFRFRYSTPPPPNYYQFRSNNTLFHNMYALWVEDYLLHVLPGSLGPTSAETVPPPCDCFLCRNILLGLSRPVGESEIGTGDCSVYIDFDVAFHTNIIDEFLFTNRGAEREADQLVPLDGAPLIVPQ